MVAERGWSPERGSREQIADVHASQVVEQIIEVPKMAEQILDVPVLETVEQSVKLPNNVPQDRIQQRTVEQIVDARVPQAVEELADVFRVFSQDRIQERTVEQTIPATSLAETIVVVPVIHMQGTTQRGVHTHAQHIVNAVEVEKPKIIELTVQRKKFIIQEKINQETKPVEFPQAQFLDKADDMPVVVQRQVSTAQTVQRSNGGSTVAVHRQSREHPCCGAETDFHDPDCSEEHRDFTVAGRGCPCCCGRAGSTGARRDEDSRDPTVAG